MVKRLQQVPVNLREDTIETYFNILLNNEISIKIVKIFRLTLNSTYATALLEKLHQLQEGSSDKESDMPKYIVSYLGLVEQEAQDYVSRILELCEIFGLELTQAEINTEICKYRFLSLFASTIDQWKYTSNLIFLRHFQFEDQYVPLEPHPTYLGMALCPRRLKVWLQQKRGRTLQNMKHLQLVYTIFQGLKKGFLPVQPEKVVDNLLKHAETLSKDLGAMSDEARDCIERTTFDVTRGMQDIGQKYKSNMSISSKSTIESN